MAGWSGMAGEHDFVVPDQARAQGLADALAAYGFALVAAGPRRQGGWGVRAYDNGPYPADRVGYRSFRAVGRHAVVLARQHGGYWSGGSQCDPSMMPSSPPDAPIVLANPGNRPPVPTLVITPAPPAARLALTPDRVVDAAADAAVDLTRLEDIPWAQLDHAHGAATDIADLIRALVHQPDDFAAVLDELLGDDLLHQGTCYSATAPAMTFLTQLIVSGSLPASRRLELYSWLVYAADRWAASLLGDADRAAVQHRPPAADPWTQDVRRAVAGELPALLARWGKEPPALRYVLACLAALYPDRGRIVADEVAAIAAEYTNTQHGAYLQLAAALVRTDDDQALVIARDILAWEDDLDPGWLDAPGVTTTLRAGHVLAEGVLRTAGDTD
jgi:hypothetical protein